MLLESRTTEQRLNILAEADFHMAAALEAYDGIEIFHKFGDGILDTGNEFIWDLMATQAFDFLIDQNVNMTIQSDNAGDTGQTIEISYVEYVAASDTWVRKTAIAVTNGLGSVTAQEVNSVDDHTIVGDANIMMPYRMRNLGTGVTNEGGAIGVITLENGGIVYAAIQDGNNQTLMTMFPVPSGYTLLINNAGRAVIDANKDSKFQYVAALYGEPFQVKGTLGINAGASADQFTTLYVAPEKTIVAIKGRMISQTGEASAWFDGYLVDNSKWKITEE